MSTFKIDLDYNSAHVKRQILLLEIIYQELLRQERADEDEEQRRNKCRNLKKENRILKHLVELHGVEESKEIEPIPEPIVEPVVEPVVEKRSDKIICECGIEIVKRNMKRHCTSKNHIFNMEIKKKKENTDLQI